jgi:hypothetical protein
VSELVLGAPRSSSATGCDLIGDGQKADCVWTRKQFIALCEYMMNSNVETHFMHVYRDELGNAKFMKSKRRRVHQRVTWAWDSILRKAKRSVGIGFYPSNLDRMSRWGAIDLDARSEKEAKRARRLALAAFEVLRRDTNRYLLLEKSGSEGWHLFVFTLDFHPISEWTRLLKQLASRIGAEVKPGSCEIFPNEIRGNSLPYGIRAPGTWNPKTDQFGLIFFDSTSALLSLIQKKKEESPFPYHSTATGKAGHLNDRDWFYSGDAADWQRQFAILHPGTRHQHLKDLVSAAFRQAGRDVVRRNAEAQFLASQVTTNAALAEHLEEFEELWLWMENQWSEELPDAEKSRFDELSSRIEKDLFRILLNFAQYAAAEGRFDFPFSTKNVGERLDRSFQHISNLRQRFVTSGIIVKTTSQVPNVSAARYRWPARTETEITAA